MLIERSEKQSENYSIDFLFFSKKTTFLTGWKVAVAACWLQIEEAGRKFSKLFELSEKVR